MYTKVETALTSFSQTYDFVVVVVVVVVFVAAADIVHCWFF